jgi:outer membrane receptor for ferrienterochelin and colicin
MQSRAQTVSGHVYELVKNKKSPLEGAAIKEIGFPNGVLTDESGAFEITMSVIPGSLEVSYVSHETDTIHVAKAGAVYEVVMEPKAGTLGGAEINRRRKSYGIRSIDPKTTINLTEREFQKAACCNLSESFENAPAIDVSFTDAVTGTKQIKMLGLAGVYTSTTREFMPAVRGLNSFYGLSFIPAAWVNSIQITKGAGSVVNGFESMTGQINVEMKKPFGREDVMVDQFISESGRSETDVMVRKDLNQYVATQLFGRFAIRPFEMDRNNDGFMDNPVGQQVQVMNRWQFYSPKGYEGQLSASYNNDKREAGQLGDNPLYKVNIENEQFDVWGKLGKMYKDKPYKSFGSQYAFNTISSQTTYGNDTNQRVLRTNGKTAYANLMYQSIIGSTAHEYKIGASILSDWVEEGFDTFQLDRTEHTVGLFTEYTWKPDSTWVLVGGARVDHSSLFGLFPTFRIHGKKNSKKGNTTLRFSAGNGWRTPNFFAQNQNLLISNRLLVIRPEEDGTMGIIQESSINGGVSLHHKFKLTYMPAEVQIDYYHTRFMNELLIDRETNNILEMRSLEDGTVANSAQIQFDLTPVRRTEIRLAYRMFDVTTTYGNELVYGGGRLQKPFVAKHRGFVNWTQSNRKGYQLSTTVQLYGPQRIPGTQFRQIVTNFEMSPAFILWNAQVSKRWKGKPWEVYVGMENILNTRQENPIAGAENPFGSNFDAALVWGPVFGRMAYGGFRYRLKQKDEH